MTPSSLFLEKQVASFLEELAKETDAVRQSSMFKEYLDTMARFWHYSYHNQILIFLQNKSASRVAGFATWNKLGRYIKKGSKAIKILAPFTKKIKKKEGEEEKEGSFTYFVPVSVFDVSQTDGKTLPKLDIEVTGEKQKWLLDKLLEFCQTKSIKVEFKPLGINGLYGYSQGGKIAIGSNQSINMQANTLIHEIAHELTHYSDKGGKFSKQEKEIQAEATTYAVTKALGLENKSSVYLALYTSDKEKIMNSVEIISNATKQILEKLEAI